MKSLTPAQRQHLKALAHSLKPVVIIGNQGLSDTVKREIDSALAHHELIKIKANADDAGMRQAWLETICTDLNAAAVQAIGKILVVYRRGAEPVIALPQ
jgi:RNA-binding protein